MRSHIVGKVDLDADRLKPDLQALASIPRIEEEYDEFSSGYWKNLSLWNSSGDPNDTMYKDIDGAAIATAHADAAPYLAQIVRDVFNENLVKMVRARNLVDAMVVPHRDFVELEKDNDQYFRTFMVLEENEDAFHADSETVIRMRPGEIWFLDAAAVHSAVNLSSNSRQSICVDFAFEGKFAESDIFSDQFFYNPHIAPDFPNRKPFVDSHRDSLVQLGDVIDADNFKEILFLMSKVHYRYEVHAADTYDWLIEACQRSEDHTLVTRAEQVRNYMIGQRSLGERMTEAG